jgi:hypothetical protein
MAVLTARLCRLTYKVKTSQEIICGKKLSMRLQKNFDRLAKPSPPALNRRMGDLRNHRREERRDDKI